MKNAINIEIPKMDMDALEPTKLASNHGLVRTMERTGKNWEQAMRMIRNARDRGKTVDELELRRQRLFASKRCSLGYDGMNEPRVYDGYLFIFSASGCLITMFELPKGLVRKTVYDGKTRVRDVKKYNRFNENVDYAADDESAA